MNKSEFIDKLSKELSTTKAEANKNLDAMLKCIAQSMKDNDNLKLVGFGTFKAKHYPANKVKTPKGTIVEVPASRRLSFSVGSELKNVVNGK